MKVRSAVNYRKERFDKTHMQPSHKQKNWIFCKPMFVYVCLHIYNHSFLLLLTFSQISIDGRGLNVCSCVFPDRTHCGITGTTLSYSKPAQSPFSSQTFLLSLIAPRHLHSLFPARSCHPTSSHSSWVARSCQNPDPAAPPTPVPYCVIEPHLSIVPLFNTSK